MGGFCLTDIQVTLQLFRKYQFYFRLTGRHFAQYLGQSIIKKAGDCYGGGSLIFGKGGENRYESPGIGFP